MAIHSFLYPVCVWVLVWVLVWVCVGGWMVGSGHPVGDPRLSKERNYFCFWKNNTLHWTNTLFLNK